MAKNLDKIKEKIMSLDFNEKEVERLSKGLEREAYDKADLAKLLNMCLVNKKIFKNLKIVEDAIAGSKEELASLNNDKLRLAQKVRENTANYDEQVRVNAIKLREVKNEDMLSQQKNKKECTEKVNKYMKDADEKIKAIEKNIRAAEKREQVANTKADTALLRKEELLESLK